MANDEVWRRKLAAIDKRARKARVKRQDVSGRRLRRRRAVLREAARRLAWRSSTK